MKSGSASPVVVRGEDAVEGIQRGLTAFSEQYPIP